MTRLLSLGFLHGARFSMDRDFSRATFPCATVSRPADIRSMRRARTAFANFTNLAAEKLVLIRGQVVDMRCDGGTPSHTRCFKRAEVISVKPSAATQFRFGCAVECVETDPKPIGVSAFNQGAQA